MGSETDLIVSAFIGVGIALATVLVASIPTTREILRKGNAADPLRAEIEQEERERKAKPKRAA